MDSLLNFAPCGFVAFRDDGTIAEINETLAELLGYTPAEISSSPMETVLPPGGRIFYHTHIFPLLKMHGRVDEVYLALRRRDGTDVPMLMNAFRRLRNGEMLSDCILVRMIQRHQYEDQLLQARRLAEEANAAKAKFLSMMSHDLRTPLTAIYGNAGALQKEMHGPLNDEQRDALEVIRDASGVLTRMINDILDFAKLESGPVRVTPSIVTVPEAISHAASLVRTQATSAGVTLTVVNRTEPPSIVADPDRIRQILLNLLTNAIKFTPPGGGISIECDSVGSMVEIRVIDEGIGIAPQDLERVFSPFVQVQAAGQPLRADMQRGVGLGLAISRDLARAMGGDVSARSTLGAGSVFTVAVPAAETSATNPSQRPAPSEVA